MNPYEKHFKVQSKKYIHNIVSTDTDIVALNLKNFIKATNTDGVGTAIGIENKTPDAVLIPFKDYITLLDHKREHME